MNSLDIVLIKKFKIGDIYVKLPTFYNNVKEETKLSYLLLNFLYYNKFKRILDVEKIYKNKNGKPYIKKNASFFNISHSKNYVCCCLSSVNIGVDIEEKRLIKKSVENKFKHKNDDLLDSLYVWNLKEAYSKYLGLGLKLDFSRICVEDIKIFNTIYTKKYNKLYLTLCYEKSIDVNKNIKLINKKDLMSFYYKFYEGSVKDEI